MPWTNGGWSRSSGRSTTTTEAAHRFGSANGVPPSVPLQAPKLWPPRIRSTSCAQCRTTPSSRVERVTMPRPWGHHSTPSCSSATTQRAPSRRSARASAPTSVSTGAGAPPLSASTRGFVRPITPSEPASLSTTAVAASSPSTLAASSGKLSRAAAACSASRPSSKSWFPAAAAAIGRPATSSHGRARELLDDEVVGVLDHVDDHLVRQRAVAEHGVPVALVEVVPRADGRREVAAQLLGQRRLALQRDLQRRPLERAQQEHLALDLEDRRPRAERPLLGHTRPRQAPG